MAQVYAQLLRLTDRPPGRAATDRSSVFFDRSLNWYRVCIHTAQELGATALQGRTFLELGDLYLTADNPDAALDAYRKSIALFEHSDAGLYLQHARERLDKLKNNHS